MDDISRGVPPDEPDGRRSASTAGSCRGGESTLDERMLPVGGDRGLSFADERGLPMDLIDEPDDTGMPRESEADEEGVAPRLEEDQPDEVSADADAEPAPAAADSESQSPPPDALGRVLCALLLASRESQSLLRLAQATHTTTKDVRAGLDDLRQNLEQSGLPLELAIAGDQVRLLTSPDVFAYLKNLRSTKKQEKLSAAALETLAVIAYRQPVIRAEIEAIRGVKAGPILRTLLDHRMIKISGRADVPGRPLQYGTTQHFLESFGLESLSDLPSVKEFRSL